MKVLSCMCFAMIVALTGCASSPSSQKQQIVYNPPPYAGPFSLTMSMASRHSYRIADEDYSFHAAEAYIKAQEAKSGQPYTVLLGGDSNTGEYMCFVALMRETGAAGYVVSKDGSPKVIKFTLGINQYTNLLRDCERQ